MLKRELQQGRKLLADSEKQLGLRRRQPNKVAKEARAQAQSQATSPLEVNTMPKICKKRKWTDEEWADWDAEKEE